MTKNNTVFHALFIQKSLELDQGKIEKIENPLKGLEEMLTEKLLRQQ